MVWRRRMGDENEYDEIVAANFYLCKFLSFDEKGLCYVQHQVKKKLGNAKEEVANGNWRKWRAKMVQQ